MIGNERKKVDMRVKNDLIIKYYQEQQLAGLSFEERGILFTLLFKLQDTENLRFEKMTDAIKEIILQDEELAETKRTEIPIERRVIFETALSTINGQTENSKEAFYSLQNRLNGQGNTEGTEQTNSPKTTTRPKPKPEPDTTGAEWVAVKAMVLKNEISEKEYENIVKYEIVEKAKRKGINPLQATQEILNEYLESSKKHDEKRGKQN